MKRKFLKSMMVLCVAVLAGSGCGSNQNASPEKNVNIVQTGWEQKTNQSPAQQAELYVGEWKGVTKAIAVNSKKELVVAIKLKTFDRFNSQQIVKKIEKTLQKRHPKVKVQVSSDKKVFMEISDLKTKLKNGQVSPQKLEKKFKRIDQFIKDQDPSKQ